MTAKIELIIPQSSSSNFSKVLEIAQTFEKLAFSYGFTFPIESDWHWNPSWTSYSFYQDGKVEKGKRKGKIRSPAMDCRMRGAPRNEAMAEDRVAAMTPMLTSKPVYATCFMAP